MLLTAEERCRFCEWLRQDIESSKAIIGQMEKLGMPGTEALVKKMHTEATAEAIVLWILETTEMQTIGS